MCLLLLYSCFVLLHQNLVSHNYFATHNTFSTKTLLSTLFFITKNRFSKPMKKKRPRLKKSPYLAIEHTRILTNSTTTLPQTKNTHHSEIYSLEFIFFLINFQFIIDFLLHFYFTETQNHNKWSKRISTQGKNTKQNYSENELKPSTHSKYVCSTKIFHYILQCNLIAISHFIEKHTMQIKTNKQQHYKT